MRTKFAYKINDFVFISNLICIFGTLLCPQSKIDFNVHASFYLGSDTSHLSSLKNTFARNKHELQTETNW